LALVIVEKEGWERVASAGIDYYTAIPPADAGWAHKQAVYIADRYAKSICPKSGIVGRCGEWRGGNEVTSLGRRGSIGKIYFDIGVVGITE
jgi:hypothetical protein